MEVSVVFWETTVDFRGLFLGWRLDFRGLF